MRTRYAASVLFLCAAFGAPAANPPLGFLTADGSFQLDQSRIWGTATIFEGSLVETKLSPCRIHLSDGSEVELDAQSKARFFRGRAVIESGALHLQSSTGYRIEARAFRITAPAAGSIGTVRLEDAAGVAASAAKGQLLITNAEGALLADVAPGRGVALSPEPGGAGTLTKISGCLTALNRSMVLLDQASNVRFVVRGNGVESKAGSRVEITGAQRQPAGAAQASGTIEASHVGVIEKGGCDAPAGHPATTAIIRGYSVSSREDGPNRRRRRLPELPIETSRERN